MFWHGSVRKSKTSRSNKQSSFPKQTNKKDTSRQSMGTITTTSTTTHNGPTWNGLVRLIPIKQPKTTPHRPGVFLVDRAHIAADQPAPLHAKASSNSRKLSPQSSRAKATHHTSNGGKCTRKQLTTTKNIKTSRSSICSANALRANPSTSSKASSQLMPTTNTQKN